MFNFRQKIITIYFIVFIAFVGLAIPFATRSAAAIMYHAMEDRMDELLEILEKQPNEVSMLATLKEQKPLLFYRVTLINNKKQVLYDTHTKRLVGGSLVKELPVNHPEILQALKEGIGYHEEYSHLLKQEFAYMARVFYLQGQEYILRISFPLRYVNQVTKEFKIGFVFLSSILLLLYTILSWIILNHLTKPIQKIIQVITPYQEGKTETIPIIDLNFHNKADEFVKLGNTLNSLSKKIKQQINRLISEREEKELLLESLIEGVVAIDPKGDVIYANKRALELFSVTDKKELFLESPPKIEITSLGLIKKSLQTEKSLSEIVEVLSEGGKRFYNLVAVPLKGEEGALLVIQDQTSQLQIVEMKRDFVANASHELRTPITIIQGFAETLQEPRLTPTQVRTVTEKIINNCERLTTLIRELLLLSDIEHLPESRLEEIDLLQIIHKCQEQLQETYPNATVQVKSTKQSFLTVAVPSLIERAILNMMDNGLKYSPDSQKLVVSLKDSGKNIEISIQDFGLGMSDEDLQHIFNRFYRSNQVRSRQLGGSGLGLAIVETIIQKHHGKILVTSTLGQGTEFTLLLPKKMESIL